MGLNLMLLKWYGDEIIVLWDAKVKPGLFVLLMYMIGRRG